MKVELPVQKRSKIEPKETLPVIFFENRMQQAVWECILRDQIDTGFWSKVRFEKNRYILAKTFTHSAEPGISFPPSQTSFYFDNLDFVAEEGYYVAMVMKLAENFSLDMEELRMLAGYVESFILVDFLDDNSNYRRIQVGRTPPDLLNISEDQKQIYKDTEAYFRNRGVEMDRVISVMKNDPFSVKEVRHMLVSISEVLKKRVDLGKFLNRVKESA